MGIGKYHSGSTAESIMYWTTDLGFDVDISEFVQSEEKRVVYGKTKCYYWYATVTFKDYSYVLETSHFNLNILAEDIKKHLISINHPEFEYLIKDYNSMAESMFKETFQKFGSTLNREKTSYNPSKNEYKCYYSLLKYKPLRKDIVYTHTGKINEYISGSFFEHIKYLAKNNQIDNIYPVEISGVANKLKILATKILEKNGNKSLKLGKLSFNINEDKYYLEFVTSINKKQYITHNFDPDPESIKTFLHENFPEYLI